MKTTNMKIKNPKGLNLDAYVVPNQNGVVLCHGFMSSKDNETHKGIIENLVNNNIGVFSFDFSAHGKSEGDLKDFSLENLYGDLATVVVHARNIFPNKLGIYASSISGYVGLLYSSYNPIDVLALRCPLVDPVKSWDCYLTKKNINNPEPLKSYLAAKGKTLVDDALPIYEQIPIMYIPTAIVGAEHDELVHPDDIKKLSSYFNECSLNFLSSDHDFTDKVHHDKMVDLISNWFVAKL